MNLDLRKLINIVDNTVVENQLSSLVSQDQDERKEYQQYVQTHAKGDWSAGAKMYAQLKGRPVDDIFGERSRLETFIRSNFDYSKFSKKDWDDYWLLAQHCDFDRKFQQRALGIIKQYLGAKSSHYQYLYDRISCGLTGTQKYGTQTICSLDPAVGD